MSGEQEHDEQDSRSRHTQRCEPCTLRTQGINATEDEDAEPGGKQRHGKYQCVRTSTRRECLFVHPPAMRAWDVVNLIRRDLHRLTLGIPLVLFGSGDSEPVLVLSSATGALVLPV